MHAKNPWMGWQRLQAMQDNQKITHKEVKKLKMTIDYTAEVTRLDSFVPGKQSKFWKPKAGQYVVKALTELEDAPPFEKEGEPPKQQAKIDLLIGEETFTWTMAIGVSPACAYGQLCKLGKDKGHLKDLQFIIAVVSDNNKNTYTVVKLP